MHEEFRPWFGRMLSVVIGAGCALALAVLVITSPATALRAAPWLGLVALVCWAIFWRPAVVVDDGGVHLVNVLRTIDLPWPSILAVDTKWALTLLTAYGQFTAWAAPAPGARAVRHATKRDVQHLPGTTADAGAIRPGDLPSSPSGGAALLIRRHWEHLRDAGHLDDPRLERETAQVTWHWGTIAGAGGLAILAIVMLFV